MRKKDLLDVEHVASARDWAGALVKRESRGPGDTENAMRRLEARYGIPWRTFWSLRYRPPRDILHGIYLRLHAAHQSECERQMRLLKHELEITKARAGSYPASVRAAEAMVHAER